MVSLQHCVLDFTYNERGPQKKIRFFGWSTRCPTGLDLQTSPQKSLLWNLIKGPIVGALKGSKSRLPCHDMGPQLGASLWGLELGFLCLEAGQRVGEGPTEFVSRYEAIVFRIFGRIQRILSGHDMRPL